VGICEELAEESTLWGATADRPLFRNCDIGDRGNDIVLPMLPEPTALLLAAADLLGLVALQRRVHQNTPDRLTSPVATTN